jgi:hypothetical protein
LLIRILREPWVLETDSAARVDCDVEVEEGEGSQVPFKVVVVRSFAADSREGRDTGSAGQEYVIT